MLISNSRGFIFIHLHKCAGTSVEVALSSTLAWNDLLLGSTPAGEYLQRGYQPLFGLYKHSSAEEVRNVVGGEFWSRCFTFATVRNPFALAVSQYTYSQVQLVAALRQRDKARSGARERGEASLDGRQFPRNPAWPWTYPGVKALTSQHGTRTSFSDFIRSAHLEDWIGFSSMRAQLCDASGALLVNEVIRQEDLGQRWPGLCQRLGVPALTLGRENASVRGQRHFREYYASAADVERVRSAFAGDFEFFGYDDGLA